RQSLSRRRLLVMAAALAAAPAFAAAPALGADKLVRIGVQKYGTLIVLQVRGELGKRLAPPGVAGKWNEVPGRPPAPEALATGSIDFGTTGEAPPVFAQAAGAELVYTGVEPPAPKGEAILVPKDSPIKSVAELKGKRIALNKGSNVHYLLVEALAKAGLSPADVRPVYLAPADGRAAFESGVWEDGVV